MGYGNVTVGSGTATLVVPANTQRLSLIITNNGSSSIYVGDDPLVSSTTGITIESGGNYTEDSGGQRTYLGDYYAISEDSTNEIHYWERER